MKVVFVELPAFTRYRSTYLDEATFLELQQLLMNNPEAGSLIPGTGGVLKLRIRKNREEQART